MAENSGHHELGFASIEAYALERCERAARWVQQARALARRLNHLPLLRGALMDGRISWSMVSVVARVAQPDDEAGWLVVAQRSTVREMQAFVTAHDEPTDVSPSGVHESTSALEDNERCTLTVTADWTDAWLFECARWVVERVSGARDDESVVEALLAEALSTLAATNPQCVTKSEEEEAERDRAYAMQHAWEEQRALWRDQAEGACEHRIPKATVSFRLPVHEPIFGQDPVGIDQQLRELSRRLVTRDLDIGRLAERFWRADGWRRLGYATDTQYARERLGLDVTAVGARRRLARKLRRLPCLTEAIEKGAVGYEAARLVARIATEDSEASFVERATARTVVHLREEVDALEMLRRLTGRSDLPMPSEAVMRVLADVERAVVSGEAFVPADSSEHRGAARRGKRTDLMSAHNARCRDAGEDRSAARRDAGRCEAGEDMSARREDAQCGKAEEDMSAVARELFGTLARAFYGTRFLPGLRSLGRTTLRLSVQPETRRQFRWLEDRYRRYAEQPGSFLQFLCWTLISTWNAALDTGEAYQAIYARDRYRCQSPVCRRRDVTPHHLRFRSAGGDDRPENVIALCVWCHLEGIHEGRLRAWAPASAATFAIGRRPHTRVEGRMRTRWEPDEGVRPTGVAA